MFRLPNAHNLAKGAKPDMESMRRFQTRDDYVWNETRGVGYFRNLSPEASPIKRANLWEVGKYYLFKHKNASPKHPLPFVDTNFHALYAPKPSIVWFGHSSLLVAYHDVKILIDPIFSDYASPYPFINRAFKAAKKWRAQDFGRIDLIIITHDHYDHLDYPTICALKGQVAHFITPLGVGAHLRHWGIETDKITELGWWESVELEPLMQSCVDSHRAGALGDLSGKDYLESSAKRADSIPLESNEAKSRAHTLQGARLSSVPSQHSSGRGLEWDRSLWSAYVLELGGVKVFLSGDGGYSSHFKEIGRRFGGIDLAALENGQYNTAWAYSHSFTPQVFEEARELGAKMVLPIHYGRFVAGSHAWNEPLQNLLRLCDEAGLPISVPRLGEVYEIGSPPLRTPWWEM